MNLSLSATRPLTDCFSSLFAYVMTFRQNLSSRQPAFDEVRTEIKSRIQDSQGMATKNGCSADEYDLARYAVCAWIDESILGSAWQEKHRWRPEMLQRQFYGSIDAGERFYQRLKNLEAHQQAVREVYTLCLALGFKGRYCAPDDSLTLDQLKERQMKWLFNSVAEVPTPGSLEKNILFPEAYPTPSTKIRPPFSSMKVFWLVWSLAPVSLVVLLFASYYLTLAHVATSVIKVMP